MQRKQPASRTTRVIATLLACVWLAGGAWAVAQGVLRGAPLPVLIGAVALWYGLVWARVAYAGRRLQWPDGLFPWRR